MKLAHKMLLGFLTVVFLIWIVGYFATNFSKKALEQAYIENAEVLIIELMDKVDRHIHGNISIFQEYSKDLILQKTILESNEYFDRLDNIQAFIDIKNREWTSVPKKEITPFMQNIQKNDLSDELREKTEFHEDKHSHVVFAEVFVTNKYGANIAQTGKTTDYRQNDEEWWQTSKREGLFVGDVAYEESAEVYSVNIGIRVDDKNGNFIGVIKAVLNFNEVIHALKSIESGGSLKKPKATEILLVNNAGRLLYSNKEGKKIFEDVSDVFEPDHFKDKQSGFFLNKKNGEVLYVHAHSRGFLDFKGLDWNLVIGHKTDELFASVAGLRQRILVISLIVTMLAISISLLISYSVSKNIHKLKEAASKIGRGDLDSDIDIDSKDEIGQLAGAFRKMAQDLKASTVKRDELAKEIQEREKMQDLIVQAKMEWEETFDSINDVILIIDKDFNIIQANKAAEKILGLSLSDILGQKYYKIYHGTEHPIEMCPACQSLKTGSASAVEFFKPEINKYLKVNAFPRFDKNNKIIGLVHIARDITAQKKVEEEQKQLQSQLRHAQKLESIGTLAGGIAHDFNNILNVIIGFGTIIEMNMKEDDPLRPHLKEIFTASERATHLTQSLLAFSRKQIIKIEPININEVVIGVKKMLARIIGEDIELVITQKDKDPIVTADYGQIEQVLMNLATNAKDVMSDGGRLTVKTLIVELDDRHKKSYGYGEPGRYALLSVTDTGAGMDEETREKIFEPFYTTKEIGKGTGLGLSIVYGIVKQHNGYIDVDSEPGKGSTFKIYLPLTEPGVEKTEKIVLPPPAGGTETILVAEDEAQVRKLVKEVLEGAGYTVIEAEDGKDAVNKFMENKDKIQMLMLDVIMPHKNGKEVYEEIKKINPAIKSIFTSGYTADIVHKKGIFDKKFNYISKPVAPSDLLRKIREVLNT